MEHCWYRDTNESRQHRIFQVLQMGLSNVENCKVIFAYEPLWAIGTGLVPAVKNINQAVKIIKETCIKLGFEPTILYGGSVDAENYKELIKADIQGFLVGGTSLKIDEFIKLVKGVDYE